MKKSTLFIAVLLVCGALSSCLRSDDLEVLRHPINVTGSISPQYGIPVASGEMNINDLLSNLSSEYQGLITDDNVITLDYEAHMSDTILAFSQIPNFMGNVAPARNYAKDGTTWYSKDTTIIDTIDIDFFTDVADLSGQIDMEHIWLNLAVRAYGECPESIRPYVRATFDNLAIKYEDHNGTLKTFNVVCGSFSKAENANNLRNTLVARGYSAQVAQNPETGMYRVIASSFDDRASAIQSRDMLRGTYPDAWILYRTY